MQVNVPEAKTQLSRVLELVESGETVIIARQGNPVAELVPARKQAGFGGGLLAGPMSDEESDAWVNGQ